ALRGAIRWVPAAEATGPGAGQRPVARRRPSWLWPVFALVALAVVVAAGCALRRRRRGSEGQAESS
ncbi:MAG: hypothetical protein M3N21_04830, partial [Actinomycetota bacterium]|nr:hypothetical protein [Actinomycetota bacterium]